MINAPMLNVPRASFCLSSYVCAANKSRGEADGTFVSASQFRDRIDTCFRKGGSFERELERSRARGGGGESMPPRTPSKAECGLTSRPHGGLYYLTLENLRRTSE